MNAVETNRTNADMTTAVQPGAPASVVPSLELRDVSFAYRVTDENGTPLLRTALVNCSLAVRPGEFIVLTGNSGCGKTTVCRLVNGLIPHYFEGELSGDVLLGGKPAAAQSIYETARSVGSVFQNPRSQFFNVDTTSELAFAAENQGRDSDVIRRQIAETSERLELGQLLGRSMFALSGGEKQKIACGSVAVADTEVVVLDEPSSNLDLEGIEALRRTLELWKRQGKTIVIAEHRLFYLRELADRVLVFQDGAIVRTLDARAFAALTTEGCAEMDLRTTDVRSISFQPRAARDGEEITLTDVRFHYSRECGVDILFVAFPRNCVTAIVGQNGAGKSTMARTLCGLNKRAKGTVTLGDQEAPVKTMLPRCFMVMQDVNHQLFTDSVLEEVKISVPASEPAELQEAKARDALRLLDMEGFADKHPMSLSGGQKQRVAIASAIAADKEILIFDEPTSGLDYRHMRQTAEVLQMLRDLGKTVLVITHDVELIALCAEHVIRMDRGTVASSRPLDEGAISELISC